ncbi:DNA damage-binding protein CMR1 {ECO:0000250/UniProtKB:Q12510} [Serendipita indica DSM 11827]|nr:DNA damage-binding protein CMR1 {ECO:0000250/UniProtKB:Q12510} [Serendipita indica DSM 11827]
MPSTLTDYERIRQQNIEANRVLLQQLDLDEGPSSLGFVPIAKQASKPAAAKKAKTTAKPVQPRKRKRTAKDDGEDSDNSSVEEVIRRSTRRTRRRTVDPNETPEERAKREQEEEARALEEEKARLAEIERTRKANEPRHDDVPLSKLLEDVDAEKRSRKRRTTRGVQRELEDLTEGNSLEASTTASDAGPPLTEDAMSVQGDDEAAEDAKVSPEEQSLLNLLRDVSLGGRDASDGANKAQIEKQKLKSEMTKMRVVARAKVTNDRVYSMEYHPDKHKDLLFYGDKHGLLGIWDPLAPTPDELEEEDEEKKASSDQGQFWRLQVHWPATSKSSISCVKFSSNDAHSVYTSSYDCTIRRTDFTKGISTELYAIDDVLISSFDFSVTSPGIAGNELWISDAKGGVSHLDLRASRHEARRYQLSVKDKIGCVSLNPVDGWSLLASSNDRTLKLWDTRQLLAMPKPKATRSSSFDVNAAIVEPLETDYDDVSEWMKESTSKKGSKSQSTGHTGTLRGHWAHGFSVTSAYWDPSGTKIVSISYDDKLRLWDLPRKYLLPDEPLKSFRPAVQIEHDCQTGRWVTPLKARWSQNSEAYPYFSVGDMKHSLKLFAADGELLAALKDSDKITAVQAVTATHPAYINRAASGNASGRCVLWSSEKV